LDVKVKELEAESVRLRERIAILSGDPAKAPDGKEEGEREVFVAYLKRALLQFFLQGDAKRDHMIPVILQLVGASPDEIRTAQRHWTVSQHWITQTLDMFPF
jgi:hypothetical protein